MLAPLLDEAGGQRQSAAAEGEFAERDCQCDPIPWILQPAWDIHQNDEEEKRQSEQTCGEARLNPGHQAEAGGDEAGAYEVGPKVVPGNPRRDDRSDGIG